MARVKQYAINVRKDLRLDNMHMQSPSMIFTEDKEDVATWMLWLRDDDKKKHASQTDTQTARRICVPLCSKCRKDLGSIFHKAC